MHVLIAIVGGFTVLFFGAHSVLFLPILGPMTFAVLVGGVCGLAIPRRFSPVFLSGYLPLTVGVVLEAWLQGYYWYGCLILGLGVMFFFCIAFYAFHRFAERWNMRGQKRPVT